MPQLLLFPDPRPLVERLGAEFFRQVPPLSGVYLMRDAQDTVLYVGKARNLRKRLASYRVANPDRLPRRHLRLLRAVRRIELQTCADEPGALAREAELLLSLRPRFNRAGTWPAQPRFLLWRLTQAGLDLAVAPARESGWNSSDALGGGALALRAILLRLLWCALQRESGLLGMPEGWFAGRHPGLTCIPRLQATSTDFENSAALLTQLFAGEPQPFADWVQARTTGQTSIFEASVRAADLEALLEFCQRRERRAVNL